MWFRWLSLAALLAIAASAIGAKCVTYVWTSGEDEALYGDVPWNDTDIGEDGTYVFDPPYAVTEVDMGFCGELDENEYLGVRGPFVCQAYALDVETPSGKVRVTDVETLVDLFAPIESQAEAASFARAVLDGYLRYDGATAVLGDNFLVRMTDVRDNCSNTAGFYAIAYEVTPPGATRIVAEEARKTIEGGGALCID